MFKSSIHHVTRNPEAPAHVPYHSKTASILRDVTKMNLIDLLP